MAHDGPSIAWIRSAKEGTDSRARGPRAEGCARVDLRYRGAMRLLLSSLASSVVLLGFASAAGCGGGGDTSGQGGSGASTSSAGGAAGEGGGTAGDGGGGGVPVNDFDCTPAEGAFPALKLTKVAEGFTRPVQVKFAPGDDERMFVVEQVGRIWIVKDGETLAEPFLDIQTLVANPDTPQDYHQEQGLLGIAFHPDYPKNGRFFVHYTEGPWGNPNPKGDSIIAEYRRSTGDPEKADPAQVKQILEQPQPYTNHNGGPLELSPVDGKLYIGFGDGGAAGDPDGNAQDMSTWLGKMLRIDVDSGDPYSVPAGNMTGGKPEIWSKGLRNPWRFSFDGCTGDMYIADVGQDAWEEVNIEPPGQSGRNYGWRTMEGTHCYSPMDACLQVGMSSPVTEYDHVQGTSVTGGYVYRGKNIPGARGYYFYSDFTSDNTWVFRWDGGLTVTPTKIKQDLAPYQGIASYGQDNHGELYMVSLFGSVYRIDPE